MMIERLIKILRNAGLVDVTAEEVAEMILLADFFPEADISQEKRASDGNDRPVEDRPVSPETETGRPSAPERELRPEEATQGQPEASLFDRSAEEIKEGDGVAVTPFRAPRADALPGTRKIARALRPLRRRHPSTHHFILDEEKTVRQIADGGPVSPLMRPAPEAWLEVALVFDESVTMRVWRQTLDQLQHLFERSGYFRDVRIWRLNTETEEAKLYRATANGLRSKRMPGELLDPSGRRLIIVVSDCHALAWHNGSAFRLVHDWAVKGPVAMAQVLPDLFWAGTTMTPVDATLRIPKQAAPNRMLHVKPRWYKNIVKSGGVALPILTLDEWSIAPWARAVAGASGVSVLGLVIPPPEAMVRAAASQPVAAKDDKSAPLDAKAMVAIFFETASKEAKQFVRYLASAPLSLPVMQLVQQTMLPNARQSHMAEVFLSGLLYQATSHRNPDEIIYEFYDGVRDELRRYVTEAETVRVIYEVSRYIASRIGETGDFEAALSMHGAGGMVKRLDPLSKRFAILSAEILRPFGRYQESVEKLEKLASLAPPSVSKTGPLSVESIVRQAESMVADGRLTEAEELYRRAIESWPADAGAWQGLVNVVKRGLAGEMTLRIMLAMLRRFGEPVRKAAAEAIGAANITSPVFIAALLGALQDINPLVRAFVLDALLSPTVKYSIEVIPAVISALSDEISHVRAKAAALLGRIGGDEAIAALRNALLDEDADVRKAAAGALESLNATIEDEANPARIFISYAREDEARVKKLYQQLADAGFEPWLDREHILPGEQWEPVIKKALKQSDFVIVCLSATSINRRGYMHLEINQALELVGEKPEHDVYLIPARLEECEVPEALRNVQWVNLYEPQGFDLLLNTIRSEWRRRQQAFKPQSQSLSSRLAPVLNDELDDTDASRLADQLEELTAIEVVRLMSAGGIVKVGAELSDSGNSSGRYQPVSPGGQRVRQLLLDANLRCRAVKSSDEIRKMIPLRGLNSELIAETERINRLTQEAADKEGAKFIVLETDNQRIAALRTAVDLHERFPDGLLLIDLDGRKISLTEALLDCVNPFVRLKDNVSPAKIVAGGGFKKIFSQKRVLIIIDEVGDNQAMESLPRLPRGSAMIVIKPAIRRLRPDREALEARLYELQPDYKLVVRKLLDIARLSEPTDIAPALRADLINERKSLLQEIRRIESQLRALNRDPQKTLNELIQRALETATQMPAIWAAGIESRISELQNVAPEHQQATLLGQIASAFHQTGADTTAIEFCDFALEKAQDDLGVQINLFLILGNCHNVLGQEGPALDALQKALENAEAEDDRRVEAEVHIALGLLYLRMKSLGSGVASFTDALQIARDLSDRNLEGRTLLLLGDVRLQMGDIKVARELYHQAMSIFIQLADRWNEANTNEKLGQAAEIAGELDDALQFTEQALEIFTDESVSDTDRVRETVERLRSELARRAPALVTFSFETVTLDRNGKETNRRTLSARQFVEELGEGVQFEMVEIPGGKFLMGTGDDDMEREKKEFARYVGKKNAERWVDSETPQREVFIEPFYIGKFATTQKQWRAVAGLEKIEHDLNPSPSHFIDGEDSDERPVENVSWLDAKEFCARLAKKTGRRYRLPTEAEWEYACRAGTATPFGFGQTVTPEIVNYDGNYPYAKAEEGDYRGQPVPVGSLGVANAFGLFDMHGNVWEWCEDIWHEDYTGAPADGSAWLSGGDSSRCVLRGGSWVGPSFYCRSALRLFDEPDARNYNFGFRVVVGARTP